MKASQLWRRSLLALVLSLLSVNVFAQAQTTTEPFKPEVGQPGKDVVWVPTPQALVDRMLDMAKVTAEDYVIDLGSGDGRTVITAAKRGAKAHGIEYNPDMVKLSERNAATEGVSARATFAKADIFESDFSQATVITMFLLPEINLRLRPKILNLKPGTRIVSNTFTMEDWMPDDTAVVAGDCVSWCTALFWMVPAKVEGTWQFPQGDLNLRQQFQMVSGTLRNAAGVTQISNGRLRGDQISFTAGDIEYTGRVSGDVIDGRTVAGRINTAWHATRPGR
jgi:phospholipid N-methyltransferase